MERACVDLESLSQLLLRDLGATLRILRDRYPADSSVEESPFRMTDYISEIGIERCREVILSSHLDRRMPTEVLELWDHANAIANESRCIAEEQGNVHPDSAYLVGLCHAITALPSVLRTDYKYSERAPFLPHDVLIGDASLPICLREYLNEVQYPRGGVWAHIVDGAHRRSRSQRSTCHSLQEMATLSRNVI